MIQNQQKQMTTLSSKYNTSIPSEVDKKGLFVEKVYLTEGNQVVIVVKDEQRIRSHLVFFNKNKSQWHPLSPRVKIKQLSKTQIIILNSIDCSIDKFEWKNGDWKLIQIKERQNILMKDYRSNLYVFAQSRLFCTEQWCSEKSSNIKYFQQTNKKTWKQLPAFILQFIPVNLSKLNDYSKIGWIDGTKTDVKILHVIDPLSKSQLIRKIQLIVPSELKKKQLFTISHIREISQNVYLCLCQKQNYYQYWIIDSLRQPMSGYETKIQDMRIKGQILRIFQYNLYQVKIWGFFMVCRQRNKKKIQKEIVISQKQETQVYLGICKSNFTQEERYCPLLFNLNIIHTVEENKLTVEVEWTVDMKHHYVLMLLHINDDFDDDLVKDIVDLMEP